MTLSHVSRATFPLDWVVPFFGPLRIGYHVNSGASFPFGSSSMAAEYTSSEKLQRQVEQLYESGDVYEHLSLSIAPEIWGHGDVKKACAMAPFKKAKLKSAQTFHKV